MSIPPQMGYDSDMIIMRALEVQEERILELETALKRAAQDASIDKQRAVEDERKACAEVAENYCNSAFQGIAQNAALQIMYKIEARGRDTDDGNS